MTTLVIDPGENPNLDLFFKLKPFLRVVPKNSHYAKRREDLFNSEKNLFRPPEVKNYASNVERVKDYISNMERGQRKNPKNHLSARFFEEEGFTFYLMWLPYVEVFKLPTYEQFWQAYTLHDMTQNSRYQKPEVIPSFLRGLYEVAKIMSKAGIKIGRNDHEKRYDV